MFDLEQYFLNPSTPRQRQYEAVRAIVLEKLPVETVAQKFGYTVQTLYSLVRDAKNGRLALYPSILNGPSRRQTPNSIQQLIIELRKKNLSGEDICEQLKTKGHKISVRTIERILADAGYPKLFRRTRAQRGISQTKTQLPDRAKTLDFSNMTSFSIECPIVGVFFFLPYLIESKILGIVKHCHLPKSSVINAEQAALSILLLKLIGQERISHISDFDQEPGLGLFAGLNVLPKASYMQSYSCRTSEMMLLQFQNSIVKHFNKIYPSFYSSNFINLDFHSIPHYGEESQMEKVWCGARGKTMKGANTLLVQDSESNAIIYTHADILRKDETTEILKFVDYWKTIRKSITETLVFDCKLTSYKVLDQLMRDNINFITLRKRSKTLLENTSKIADNKWQKVTLPIPKRKHKSGLVYESEVLLRGCTQPVRQIIIKAHGREQPTYVITNNRDLKLTEVLIAYAKRWHIENKISELVSFFNLNALLSPLMIRIHFDILWTLIADTFYRRIAQDLPRFEHVKANSIFRHFINLPGKIVFDGEIFTIHVRKRAHTPILMGVEKLKTPIVVPWLDNRKIQFKWVA